MRSIGVSAEADGVASLPMVPGATPNDRLRVIGLTKDFRVGRGQILKAVDDVSFALPAEQTLGLVGESGCGKSTLGRTLVHLYEPTGGTIFFNGEDVTHPGRDRLKRFRQEVQMVFQDPYASLDPRMTVGRIIEEGMEAGGHSFSRQEKRERVRRLLELVGLHPEHGHRFPHEFSGGQRQRIGIARALAARPQLVIADEPISALDVSIQAQIVNLLQRLQAELGLTYLFIAHDLRMVKYVSHRVAVMYLGRVVEMAESEELYQKPLHPYTQALLSAVPIPDPARERGRERIVLRGELPSPVNPPPGCRFASRCPRVKPICREQSPAFREEGAGHWVACHLYE